ncbi:MAG: hypothetical protein LBK95_08270, partial [Bifidobacteriaceae bacterium]|nr:hypothetical protein [Bifidobacteriaceae bacterium]
MRGLGASLALSAVALAAVFGSAELNPLAGAQAATAGPHRFGTTDGPAGAEPAPTPGDRDRAAQADGAGATPGAVGWALAPAA